jgi:predicted nucleic acid-binding protein
LIEQLEEVVPDCSVLLACIRRDAGDLQPVADQLDEAFVVGSVSMLLLDLSVYELVNVLVRRHRLSAIHAVTVVTDLLSVSELIVRVDAELASRAAEVAASTGLSGYDAAYLAAGERWGAPVLTLDETLAAAGGTHLRDLRLS